MNIRAKIFGGGSTAQDEAVLKGKKPKGSNVDSLGGLIEREESRQNHTRFEDRHRLVDETARIRCGDVTKDVQLINVSGGGAMISGEVNLMLWDKVELVLGENGAVDCVVRWMRDDRFGLEFAHETRIDCSADRQAAVLREVVRRSFPDVEFEADGTAQPEHDGPETRTERRHPLVWSGLLHHDYQSTPVRVRNISATGALVECSEWLTAGSEPVLELGGDVTIPATVAWMIGDQAGLRFSSPFDLQDLARSRPDVAGSSWEPPAYLAAELPVDAPSDEDPWDRMSIGELRTSLEGFLKR